ncbi:alpha/beta hydrolase [Fodinicola feengrottensis]
MRKKRPAGVLAAVLIAVSATGLIAAPALAAPVTAAAPTIQWGACPPDIAAEPGAAALQCGTISVPLDYKRPSGPHINVAVSKLTATDKAKRRGVMLLNPGGPGGPGLDLPLVFGSLMPASVLQSYDLIGFDPRGLGHSNPLTCGLSAQQQQNLIPYPSPDGFAAQVASQRQVVQQCFDHSGAQLPYITTANTARDMDQIRMGLGEPKISYLGYSYGTYLGAVYSSLFATHTDRIILDSSVGSQMIWRNEFRAWGPSTEIRFPDFTKWAAAQNATYGLGATSDAVRATYFRLAAKLDAHPQPSMTGNLFRGTTRGALYNDANFSALAQLWQSVDKADVVKAAKIASVFDAAPDDSSAVVLLGVLCGDTTWPKSLPQYQADSKHDARLFPVSGAMAGNVWPCAFWPKAPTEPLVPITSNGPSNILVLQNLRDPATIYSGGVQMRASLGNRARLVTVNQGGHGVYLLTPNTCAANIATAFLVDGTFPNTDKYCAAGNAQLQSKATGADRTQLIQQIESRQRPF